MTRRESHPLPLTPTMDLIRDIRKGYEDGIDVDNPRSSSVIHNVLENALERCESYNDASLFVLTALSPA